MLIPAIDSVFSFSSRVYCQISSFNFAQKFFFWLQSVFKLLALITICWRKTQIDFIYFTKKKKWIYKLFCNLIMSACRACNLL